jgi:hypothetical protein
MAKNLWRDEAGRKQSRYVFSHCEHCRQRFWKKMPWARFCSTKCRVAASRSEKLNVIDAVLPRHGCVALSR